MTSLFFKVSRFYSVVLSKKPNSKYTTPRNKISNDGVLISAPIHSPSPPSEMVFRKILGMMMGCLGFGDKRTLPSPSEASESESPKKVVVDQPEKKASPKVILSDGRCLSYRELGVPKHKSNYRVIMVHGFGSSKEMTFLAPQELMDRLGVYLLLFDRAGYGESDPNPKRCIQSEASDIDELAHLLQLGSKYYVIGVSLGCYPVWSCLKRIPHRLAGAALVVPIINYKWRTLPKDLTKDDYRRNLCRWIIWLLRHTPGLLHWWLTQKIFPSSNVLDTNPAFFNNKDLEFLRNTPGYQLFSKNGMEHRSLFESIRRDCIVAFGHWGFEPMELTNPYPDNESSVHIWQGVEDKVVPVKLQRYVSEKLPWIRYHEVPDGGHMLVYDSTVCEAILKSLLLGEDTPEYRHYGLN